MVDSVRYIPKESQNSEINRLLNSYLTVKSAPADLANDINSSDTRIGAVIYIIDEALNIQYATNKFFLTNLSFTLKERAQLVDTFSEPILSFIDESVRVYNVSGVAIDAATIDLGDKSKNFHYSSLLQLYNTKLRGTELVKDKNIAVLKIANHTIYGYPLNLTTSYTSSSDKTVAFNMAIAVAQHSLILPGQVTADDLNKMFYFKRSIFKAIKLRIHKYQTSINYYYKIKNMTKSNQESLTGQIGSIVKGIPDLVDEDKNSSNIGTITTNLNNILSTTKSAIDDPEYKEYDTKVNVWFTEIYNIFNGWEQ